MALDFLHGKALTFVGVAVLVSIPLWSFAEPTPEQPVLRNTNIRHAWLRGERALLHYEIINAPETSDHASVTFQIGDLQMSKPLRFADQTWAQVVFELDTHLLKSGTYPSVCRWLDGDQTLGECRQEISIARRWHPDRLRVWLWPHAKFGKRVWQLDDNAKALLAWYADKGFNSFAPGGGTLNSQDVNYGGMTEGKFRLYDYMLCHGWEATFSAWNGLYLDANIPEASFAPSLKLGELTTLTNPFHRAVAQKQNELNEALMQSIREFPGIKLCYVEGEIEDGLPDRLPLSEHLWPAQPTVPHSYIRPGVIADNDEGYVNALYRYRRGDGIAVGFGRLAEVVHHYRPDILIFSDPLRRTTIYNRFAGADLVSGWTYTNPDPKLMLYIETLIANAQPFQQGVLPTITLLNYPGAVAPEENGWVLMGPDRLVETSWINLSRNPDGLSYYIGSGLDPFDPGYPAGTGGVADAPQRGYPYQSYPETFEALKLFVETIVNPYGPMIRKLQRAPRKIAVLSSEASAIYSASPRLVGHYGNYQIYSFYALLNMIHLAADVVFDQTIAQFGLDAYDVLVLPKCDTLTQTVYEKILQFQARGGLVLADQYLRADIPAALKFDFDFTYRNFVSAKALIDRKDYTEKTDNPTRQASLKEVQGITAAEDQKRMEQYAARLACALPDQMAPVVACDSPTVLLNLLESPGVRYLFAINDHRTYDQRLGKYQGILEKGVSQQAKITVHHRGAETLYVYDLIEHRELALERSPATVSFAVNLPPAGGKIIAITSQKPQTIEIQIPPMPRRGQPYRIDILIRDPTGHLMAGLQPLRVQITDPAGDASEFSDYYVAQDGRCSVPFTLAGNDTSGAWRMQVDDLMTGATAEVFFQVN